jgi:hypothetical protein
LVSQKEWEQLRNVGKEAIRKYARNDLVTAAVNEVERQYMMRVAVDRADPI